MKKKRRSIRPKDPTRFSVRLTKSNLRRLKDLHAELGLHNRNMAINHIIENYHEYRIHKDFIEALRKIFREEMRVPWYHKVGTSTSTG